MPAGCRRLALHNGPIIVAASVTLAWTPRPRMCSPRRNRPRSKGTSGTVGTVGTVGTRNFLGILTTVNCSATAARQIANRMRYSGILDDYENVGGWLRSAAFADVKEQFFGRVWRPLVEEAGARGRR